MQITSAREEFRATFHPDVLVPSIIAGIVAGILAITFMFSYSAVIFTEDLAIFIPRAAGGMLFGGVVIAIVLAVFGGIRGAVALPQDNPTAIIAVMVGIMAPSLVGSESGELMFVHVAAIILISTLICALVFLAIGHWRVTSMVQYIPYPVIGGFLAGTGWLLFKGSFLVMGNVPFDFLNMGELAADAQLWVPGAVYGVLVTIIAYRYSHYLVMPGLIVSGIVLFYATTLLLGTSNEQLITAGYLLEPFDDGGLWQPITLGMFEQVKWGLLWGQVGGIATIIIIAVISALLNLTALESSMGEEVDLNRELRTAGMANIGAALGGGLIGYHYVSLSTLGHRMRGDSRIVGLVVALMCLLALTVGAGALSYFPKFILGGLVMFIGLSFLYDWVVQSWLRLSRSDFAIIMLILAVVETIGFLEAVAVGIAAASVLFVVNYSRISAVRHTFSGSDLHANVERPNRQRKLLHDQGNKTLILKLQGFIFFATASGLLKKVEQSLEDKKNPLEFLIIDFQHVTGLDSSALHGFVRIRQIVSDHGAQLVFSGMSSNIEEQFSSEQFADGTAMVEEQFTDMDHAMEACENRLLLQNGMDPAPAHHTIEELLSGLFSSKDFIERFAKHLKRHDVRAGESLYNEGDSIRSLYFVESGDFTVSLSHKGSQEHRLREVGPGAMLGVSAFFHEDSHEALVSVKAETDGAVYGLYQADFKALKAESPELVTEFQADMLRFFADRLTSSLNVLEAVLRVED
jgi:SulP family sulfate permease